MGALPGFILKQAKSRSFDGVYSERNRRTCFLLILILHMIVRRTVAALCLLLTGTLFAQSHADSAKQNDIYAIYSQLMPGAVLANLGPSKNQRWAIADTTVNIDDMNPKLSPDAALKPPNGNPKPFQEAVADFNAHKYQRRPLSRDFHLNHPYTLLSPDEVNEFRQARSSAIASTSIQQKYSGYPGITYFSDVYFDSHRRAALVYQLDWCGNVCSQGEWIYLEKQNGRWVQRSGQAAIEPGAKPF